MGLEGEQHCVHTGSSKRSQLILHRDQDLQVELGWGRTLQPNAPELCPQQILSNLSAAALISSSHRVNLADNKSIPSESRACPPGSRPSLWIRDFEQGSAAAGGRNCFGQTAAPACVSCCFQGQTQTRSFSSQLPKCGGNLVSAQHHVSGPDFPLLSWSPALVLAHWVDGFVGWSLPQPLPVMPKLGSRSGQGAGVGRDGWG